MLHIPSNWSLSLTHRASKFVAKQCLAYIHNLPQVPIPPIDLLTSMAFCQLSRVLAAAYKSECQSLPCRLVLIGRHYPVHLEIDLIRYNAALDKNQSSQNQLQESSLLERFPLVDMHVDQPLVFIDAGGRVLTVWCLHVRSAISSE